MFITCEPESKSNPNHQRHIQERHVRTSPQVSVSPNVPIPGLSQPLLFVNRCPGPLVQCSKLLRRHGGSNHSGEPSFGMEAGRKAIAPSGFRSITSTRRRASSTRAKHKAERRLRPASASHQTTDIPRHYNDDETRVTSSSMYRAQMPCAGGQQTGRDHQDEESTNAGQRQQCSNRKRTRHPARLHAPKRACRWNSKQRLFCTRSFRTKPGVEYNARWEQQLQMMMLI